MPLTTRQTTSEWEVVVGRQVRDARLAVDLDQKGLAALANVSIGSLSNLERGKGSSVRTLVAVVRALGRTDWLESLAPPVVVSPLRMLRAQEGQRQRVRARRKTIDERRF